VQHVIVPDGACTLSVVTVAAEQHPYISLTPPTETAVRITVHRGALYRGIRIKPGALYAALGIKPAQLPNAIAPLSHYASTLDQAIRQTLEEKNELSAFQQQIETLFNQYPPDHGKLDSLVMTFVDQLMAAQQVSPLLTMMQQFPISERQLRRRFIEAVGLTPKVFSRLRRVRWSCADLARQWRTSMTTISAEHGFADLPHFDREMQQVFGMSPQLLHEYLRQIQHIDVSELSTTA
jgi:AraC-like DNA-binding protein